MLLFRLGIAKGKTYAKCTLRLFYKILTLGKEVEIHSDQRCKSDVGKSDIDKSDVGKSDARKRNPVGRHSSTFDLNSGKIVKVCRVQNPHFSVA